MFAIFHRTVFGHPFEYALFLHHISTRRSVLLRLTLLVQNSPLIDLEQWLRWVHVRSHADDRTLYEQEGASLCASFQKGSCIVVWKDGFDNVGAI